MPDVSDFILRDQPACDLRRIGSHPDHWYPLAWSRELAAGKTYATTFAGEPVVLIRPKEGPVFALEDRCAHRQVPLSKGVVSGCAVRCGYHGWTYDASANASTCRIWGRASCRTACAPIPAGSRTG